MVPSATVRIPVSTKRFFVLRKDCAVPKRWSIEMPRPADAKSVASFQADLWKETYSRPDDSRHNILVVRDAQAFLQAHRIARRKEIISRVCNNTNKEYMRVARAKTEMGNKAIAALLYGAKEDSGHQELWTLYVHSAFQGKGLAQEITEGFIDWCDNDQPIDVGVDTQNRKAQRFYRKMGFEDTGEKREFNSYITEKIMRRVA